MNLFKSLKGALNKMLKALSPKYATSGTSSVLGRSKYVLSDMSRSKVELPPNQSILSMTKYFEDEDSEENIYEKKDNEMDW